MRLENLSLIGNCQFSALIDRSGNVVWCCLPRFDSEPVFGKLLDPSGGEFAVTAANSEAGAQRYLENTNVLETVFDTPDGRFRILDFAPRFIQHDRVFRPTQLVRIIEPLDGHPLLRVHCNPKQGWAKSDAPCLQGSNHIRYEGFPAPLRLTSDIPLTYLDGRAFPLTARRHLVLSWGPPVEEALAPLCERFLAETVRYWHRWVKHCSIPPMYQQQVIRSALALKLHCFEDTGAIVAAMTTSIPESPGSQRTWDYRYCWLRDSYYALDAFRRLGHFEEREHFIHYLLNVAANAPNLDLKPLYGIDGRSDLEEQILPHWAGYNGDGPVRIGNGAALHEQHDVYGEMVLALAPLFTDDRFHLDRSPAVLKLLERLGQRALSVVGTPDAGIWEYRKAWEPQTFSSLMCWAAADRVAKIARRFKPGIVKRFETGAARIHQEILTHAWHAEHNTFVSAYGGQDVDAALLQMLPLRFLAPDDPRLAQTVDAIIRHLSVDGWLYRYTINDGLGTPSVAFVICSFWLVEALATIGRADDARALMDRCCSALSSTGLMSEDYDPGERRLWGNFPQAYSHIGLINAAFAASPRWADVS